MDASVARALEGAMYVLIHPRRPMEIVMFISGQWRQDPSSTLVQRDCLPGGPPVIQKGNQQLEQMIMTGKIRTLRVDKGFGFIKDDAGNDYFFHQSAVYGEGLGDLREGDSVEFEVGQGPKGPRAENVRRTST